MRYPHLIPTPSSLFYSFDFLLKSGNVIPQDDYQFFMYLYVKVKSMCLLSPSQ
jgi:hypothetical protein